MLAAGWWFAGPAGLGGTASYVITHGVSMEPGFHTGDLAMVRATGDYRVGDIAAYHSQVLHTVVMHRIVAIDGDRYTFKGDNNSWLDPEQPARDQLIGTLALHIPQAGTWLHGLDTPPALAVMASALALILGAGTTAATHRHRRRKRRRTGMSRHLDTLTRPRRLPGMLQRPLLARTGAAAALTALAAALGAWAWAGPTDTTGAAHAAGGGARIDFSYSAAVRPSAAYDGTTVNSPDPVFRRVADTVDVHYAYTGPSGTIAVAVQLSTASGWHTTVPLKDPAPARGAGSQGDVQLDLAALEARAQAAAQATGIPATPVSVAVVPTVKAGGAAYSPALKFTLTPLQLILSDPTGLTAVQQAAVGAPVPAPRTLTLGPWSLTAGTARVASALAAALALLALAALAVAGRRRRDPDEATSIRRRWGSLLVPVEPMPTAPGRAVIEVSSFDTLAQLAERYGLLVLHWARSGVETFIVHDESITYRYRTGTAAAPREPSAEYEETAR